MTVPDNELIGNCLSDNELIVNCLLTSVRSRDRLSRRFSYLRSLIVLLCTSAHLATPNWSSCLRKLFKSLSALCSKRKRNACLSFSSAGHSKMKCTSPSTVPPEPHSLHCRSSLGKPFHLPTSISNLCEPTLNFAKETSNLSVVRAMYSLRACRQPPLSRWLNCGFDGQSVD